MRAKILLGASGLALALTTSALAGGQSTEKATPPTFSPEEVRIIHRNEALSSVVDSDPWVVRRVLDALAAAKHTKRAGARAAGINGPVAPDAQPRTSTGIDPQKNPDFQNLDRSSPEAAFDLLKLLKQVGRKGSGANPASSGK